MTSRTYPQTPAGLSKLLQENDPSFGLYKHYHWDAVVLDELGLWLEAHDEAVRATERARLEEENLLRPRPWLPIPYPDDAAHQARWTIQREFQRGHWETGDTNEGFMAAAAALLAEGWTPPTSSGDEL